MEGQLVKLTDLPSKGVKYPQDIEIYVRPLSIKQQMDMDRYGVSQAEYYNILLNGIAIHGDFNKYDLNALNDFGETAAKLAVDSENTGMIMALLANRNKIDFHKHGENL